MRNFIFGMDTRDPFACARLLRERGIDAVVLGNPTAETVAALEQEGLELFLCFGAYGVPKDSADLALDAQGQPRRWFNSGCPNDEANVQKHLDAVFAKAANLPSLRGILVDGARFASFASVEGIDPFFTCFCPRCMKAMTDMGLDAEAIREAVNRLMQTRCPQPGDEPALRQWFLFREKTVQKYMDAFAQRVHAIRSDLIAGAFIFAPSLGMYVGQTAQACRSLDVISHMLYRAYPHEFGVACLGHEWAAFKQGFDQHTDALIGIADPDSVFHVEAPAAELLSDGFAPDWIGLEVAQARRDYPMQQLWPILQIEDDQILAAAAHARENGADAVGLFMWGQADVPQL